MSDSPEAHREVELAAAEWLSRQDDGMTPSEKAELDRWLAADATHAEAFHELARAWSQLDVVRGSSKTDRRKVAEHRAAGRVLHFPRPVIAAVAASIVIAMAAWQFRAGAQASFTTTVAAEAGIPRSVHLPDGSVVQVNTGSAVEVKYDSSSRHLWLVRGEAHFSVASDTSKPFIVNVGQVAVRAVGTAFNVRLTSATVEVLVTEGRVSVDDAAKGQSLLLGGKPQDRENPVLAAGERVVVPLMPERPVPAVVASVPPVEIQQALAWKEPRLEFDTVPLKTIVAEFNRHNRHRLVIADARLEVLRFGGTFPASDHEGFVRLLVQNFGVAAETQAGQTVLRLAPAGEAAHGNP